MLAVPKYNNVSLSIDLVKLPLTVNRYSVELIAMTSVIVKTVSSAPLTYSLN